MPRPTIATVGLLACDTCNTIQAASWLNSADWVVFGLFLVGLVVGFFCATTESGRDVPGLLVALALVVCLPAAAVVADLGRPRGDGTFTTADHDGTVWHLRCDAAFLDGSSRSNSEGAARDLAACESATAGWRNASIALVAAATSSLTAAATIALNDRRRRSAFVATSVATST